MFQLPRRIRRVRLAVRRAASPPFYGPCPRVASQARRGLLQIPAVTKRSGVDRRGHPLLRKARLGLVKGLLTDLKERHRFEQHLTLVIESCLRSRVGPLLKSRF